MQKMGKSNQKETKSMNRNLVGKVRVAIIKCPRLTYSPYLTDSESVPYGQKVRTGRTKTFSLFLCFFPRLFVPLTCVEDTLARKSSKRFGFTLAYLYLCSIIANEVMTEKEIFRKEAENGYTVCFAEQCPMKEQCLRYLVGQQMPETRSSYHCVNPRYQDVGTERCSLFRSSKKVKFAKGMMHIFNADMPARVKPFVRLSLIGKHCRTYYYEYRNGTRLISPDVQEEVRGLFREAGWNEEVHFDSYIEDYEW